MCTHTRAHNPRIFIAILHNSLYTPGVYPSAKSNSLFCSCFSTNFNAVNNLRTLSPETTGVGGICLQVAIVGHDFQLAFGLLGHQVRADEGVEVAIQHAVHVAGLELGAVVLDQA